MFLYVWKQKLHGRIVIVVFSWELPKEQKVGSTFFFFLVKIKFWLSEVHELLNLRVHNFKQFGKEER